MYKPLSGTIQHGCHTSFFRLCEKSEKIEMILTALMNWNRKKEKRFWSLLSQWFDAQSARGTEKHFIALWSHSTFMMQRIHVLVKKKYVHAVSIPLTLKLMSSWCLDSLAFSWWGKLSFYQGKVRKKWENFLVVMFACYTSIFLCCLFYCKIWF